MNGMTVNNINLSDIFSDPSFNCRGSVAPVDVIDLSRDIEKRGLQYPILVRPLVQGEPQADRYKYKIISGHRRYMAHRVLSRETIPAFVREGVDESQALFMNLAENIHRKDLNVLQEAKALERLKLSGFSATEVAKELGKSATWVYVRYELLELPIEIQEAAAAGFIKNTQVRGLHKIRDRKSQLETARKIKGARIKGEKVPAITKPRKDMFKKKARDRDDIFMMQEYIQSIIGNNFGTRCLAWASGEIPSIELYRDIRDLAYKADIPYELPTEKEAPL